MLQQESLSPRRSIAAELAKIYGELAGTEQKPQPRFSLAEVFRQLVDGGGLRRGFEHEICSAASMAADRAYDPHAVVVPWSALVERDLTGSGGDTGHYLVGGSVGPVADALRPWSVAVSAGLTIAPNLISNVGFPRIDADLEGMWLQDENTAIVESQPTVGQISVSPKTWGAVIPLSHQFWRQGQDAEGFVRQQLLRVAGRALDAAILGGSGNSGEPLGLVNIPDVTTSGTSLDLSGVLAMRAAIPTANDARLAWIAAPGVRQLLAARQTVTSGSNLLWQYNTIDGRPAYVSPDAPDGTLFLADWSQVVLAMWGAGPTIKINVFGQDFTAFTKGLIQARILMDVDVVLLQKGAVYIATSVT